MESGAAGHVIPETIFPRDILERKTSPNKFVAAKGEQIRDLGERKKSRQIRGPKRSGVRVLSNVSFQCKKYPSL